MICLTPLAFVKGVFYVLYFPSISLHFRSVEIDWNKYDLAKAKELAKKRGNAALTEMMFNIQKMSLVDTGKLLSSVKSSVRTKNGFVDRIQFSYEWYGAVHNHGAENIFGKGKRLNANAWRSDAINNNLEGLTNDFQQFYAEMIADEIEIESVQMKM